MDLLGQLEFLLKNLEFRSKGQGSLSVPQIHLQGISSTLVELALGPLPVFVAERIIARWCSRALLTDSGCSPVKYRVRLTGGL
jgi:hypothetical protein